MYPDKVSVLAFQFRIAWQSVLSNEADQNRDICNICRFSMSSSLWYKGTECWTLGWVCGLFCCILGFFFCGTTFKQIEATWHSLGLGDDRAGLCETDRKDDQLGGSKLCCSSEVLCYYPIHLPLRSAFCAETTAGQMARRCHCKQ